MDEKRDWGEEDRDIRSKATILEVAVSVFPPRVTHLYDCTVGISSFALERKLFGPTNVCDFY